MIRLKRPFLLGTNEAKPVSSVAPPSAPPSEYLPTNHSVDISPFPLVITTYKSAFAVLSSPIQPSSNPIRLTFLPPQKPGLLD